jgi:hypothetical protein
MSTIYQYGDQEAALVTLRRISSFIELRLARLVSTDDALAAEFRVAQNGIAAESALTDPAFGVLAGYLQSAIRQPALVGVQLDDRFEAFSLLADDCIGLLADLEVTGYGRWIARTVQLSLSAILTSMSRIVTTSVPDSRAHAITVAVRMIDEFWDMVDALDTAAERFNNSDWDMRYFSQTTTYTRAAQLVAECVRYLLRSAYDLRIEKRYTLRQPTAPITIAIKEYPNQQIEAALDLLCKANALSGDDILLLPSGREIMVYV